MARAEADVVISVERSAEISVNAVIVAMRVASSRAAVDAEEEITLPRTSIERLRLKAQREIIKVVNEVNNY